jgi:hypothetical protein
MISLTLNYMQSKETVKVKFPFLSHEDMLGRRYIEPRILNLGIRGTFAVSFVSPAALSPCEDLSISVE